MADKKGESKKASKLQEAYDEYRRLRQSEESRVAAIAGESVGRDVAELRSQVDAAEERVEALGHEVDKASLEFDAYAKARDTVREFVPEVPDETAPVSASVEGFTVRLAAYERLITAAKVNSAMADILLQSYELNDTGEIVKANKVDTSVAKTVAKHLSPSPDKARDIPDAVRRHMYAGELAAEVLRQAQADLVRVKSVPESPAREAVEAKLKILIHDNTVFVPEKARESLRIPPREHEKERVAHIKGLEEDLSESVAERTTVTEAVDKRLTDVIQHLPEGMQGNVAEELKKTDEAWERVQHERENPYEDSFHLSDEIREKATQLLSHDSRGGDLLSQAFDGVAHEMDKLLEVMFLALFEVGKHAVNKAVQKQKGVVVSRERGGREDD